MGTVKNLWDWEPVSKGTFTDGEWIWDKLKDEVDPVQRAKWATEHYKEQDEQTDHHDGIPIIPIAAVLIMLCLFLYTLTCAR